MINVRCFKKCLTIKLMSVPVEVR